MICPNKNSQEWIEMVSLYGEAASMEIFQTRGELPTLEEIRKISPYKDLTEMPEYSHLIVNQLFYETLSRVKKTFPEVALNMGFMGDPRPAWIKGREIFVNLSATKPDGFLHEYGHVFMAVLKQAYPEKFREALSLMDKSDRLEEVKLLYPDYTHDEQREEALMSTYTNMRIKAGGMEYKALKLLDKALVWLGIDVPVLGRVVKMNEFVMMMDKTLLSGEPITLGKGRLEEIFKHGRDSRVEKPKSLNSLITFVSGRSLTENKEWSDQQAKRIVGNPAYEHKPDSGGEFFTLEIYKGGPDQSIFRYTSDNIDERREQVSKTYEQVLKSNEDKVLAGLKGDGKKAMIKEIFPEFSKGDSVMLYKELEHSEHSDLFIPNLGFSNLLVLVRGEGANRVIALANISSHSLTEEKKAPNFVYNIAPDSAFQKQVFGKAYNTFLGSFKSINVSNSPKNIMSVSMAALASALEKKVGVKILLTRGVSIDKKGKRHISMMDMVVGIDTLKKVLSIPQVKEYIKGSILENLLYEGGDVEKGSNKNLNVQKLGSNPIRALLNLEFVSEKVKADSLQKKAGAYVDSPDTSYQERGRASMELREEIMKMIGIYAAMDPQVRDSDPAYITMISALHFIDNGEKQRMNPYTESDVLEKYTSSMMTHKNTFVGWFMKVWDDKRFLTIEDYEVYMEKRQEVFKPLYEAKSKGLVGVAARKVLEDPARFYDNIYKRDVNGKKSNFLKDPSELEGEEKEFAIQYQALIKEMAREAYVAENIQQKDLKDPEAGFEKWYENTVWAKGAVPLIKSTVSSHIFRGDLKEGAQIFWDRMFEVNPYYEDQITEYSRLPNKMYSLSSFATYEEAMKNYEVDREVDLRKVLDIYTMQTLRYKHQNELIKIYDSARRMIKKTERDFAMLEGIAGRAGMTNQEKHAAVSNDIQMLEGVFKFLVFNQKKPFGDSKRTKQLEQIMKFSGVITTHAGVALSLLTDVSTTVTAFSRLVAHGLANYGDPSKFSAGDIFKTMYEFILNPKEDFKKALILSKKLRLVNMDTHDLITNRTRTDEAYSIVDARNNFLGGRIGDSTIKMILMTAMMKRDGTWDSWKMVDGKLVYDREADIKSRGKGIVELIEFNRFKETGKEVLDTTHDGTLRRTYEKLTADILGGFSEGAVTYTGTTVLGTIVGKFKIHLQNRIDKVFKGRYFNQNIGSYAYDEDGNVIELNEFDAGYLSTLGKAVSGALVYINKPSIVWNEMTLEDRMNIYRSMSYTFIFALAFFAKEITSGDDDDRKKTQFRLWESIMNDMLLLDQANASMGFLKNPFMSVFYTLRVADVLGDYVMMDFEGGTEKAKKTIGILRSAEALKNL